MRMLPLPGASTRRAADKELSLLFSTLEHRFVTFSAVIARHDAAAPAAPLAIESHLEAAVDWIVAANLHSSDGGIPAYFDALRGRWRSSYPETTGYTIPTLLACAARLGRAELGELALRLADYLLVVRTPEGGVGHWDRANSSAPVPIVFDTGQVIFGWLAAWRATGADAHRQAAVAAADWLLRIQSSDGAWRSHQHLGTVKVIDARVAWALILVGQLTGDRRYAAAARRNLEWVLSQQLTNGWFRSAAFRTGADPFTHTIAYTAEGLLESGLLLDEARYITAAETVAEALLQQQRPDGSLASTYDQDWQATSRSSCLTGNCQMGLLWLRLHARAPRQAYLRAARGAIGFTASTQNLGTGHPGIRGAIGGSWPLYGKYERLKYPNWAAKFFIDSLLALETAERTN